MRETELLWSPGMIVSRNVVVLPLILLLDVHDWNVTKVARNILNKFSSNDKN